MNEMKNWDNLFCCRLTQKVNTDSKCASFCQEKSVSRKIKGQINKKKGGGEREGKKSSYKKISREISCGRCCLVTITAANKIK